MSTDLLQTSTKFWEGVTSQTLTHPLAGYMTVVTDVVSRPHHLRASPTKKITDEAQSNIRISQKLG